MKKYCLLIVLLLSTVSSGLFSLSIFDTVSWKKVSDKDNISLYMNNSRDINFYKAEIVLEGINADLLYECLLQFENYNKIFSKKFNLKRVREVGEKKLLLYAVLDISPLKIRDYYIELEYEKKSDSYSIEWYPSGFSHGSHDEYLRVKDIYGRWQIKKLADGKVQLSVEYHNDWKVFVSQDILAYFEKKNTVDAIDKILKYSRRYYSLNEK